VTTQTEFTSWQDQPKQPDPKTCAPICISWMNYLLERWDGQNLGCYNSRPVVGGTALSSHGSGAATDWRYADPGPGRMVLLNEVLPLFVEDSMELGVQAIHDYAGSRIWRPPGQSGRPLQPSPECGWKTQSPGPQMGQSWATWIHLECAPSRWDDTRTVEQMLGPEEDEVTDADIAKIVAQVKAELPAAVWAHKIDTTAKEANIEPQTAAYWLQRGFLIARQYLGSFGGKPAPTETMLARVDKNTRS
jgi:hypothetical protein